jgi:hypothetical protein
LLGRTSRAWKGSPEEDVTSSAPTKHFSEIMEASHWYQAESLLCHLVPWDLVFEPQFTNLQIGAPSKHLGNRKRSLT